MVDRPTVPGSSRPRKVSQRAAGASLDSSGGAAGGEAGSDAAGTSAPRPAHRAAPWRGRGKVADAKDRFVAVRCTEAEHAALTAKAATAGLSVGAYIRQVGLGSAGLRARRRPPLERAAVAQLLGHLGRVGGNVNQMAREMNRTGNFPSRAELARAADDIAAMRAELMRALGRDVPEVADPASLRLPGVVPGAAP